MKDFLKSYEGKKITLVDITPFNEDLTLSEVKDSYFVITPHFPDVLHKSEAVRYSSAP